ncbi:MAG: type II secretion system F family protein [Thauera sp.]|jgi:tight adherence protein C
MQLVSLPALVALLAGLGAAGLALVLACSVAGLPPEDRTWLDRPPRFLRALWWPTRWIAQLIAPLVPASIAERQRARLRLAGLDFALSPAQLLAHRLCVAVLGGMLGTAFAAAWGLPVAGFAVAGAGAGTTLAWSWFDDRVHVRRRQLLKQLPFVLDLITLCMEAGLNLTGALQQAVVKGPEGPLRDELKRVLRDVRAGKSRADALRAFAERIDEPAVAGLVSAIIQAENMGMNLGPILRAQGEQRRNERFARAEKAAMEAPVKMLLPLIACIFPCTFLVLGFPIAVKFMTMGL